MMKREWVSGLVPLLQQRDIQKMEEKDCFRAFLGGFLRSQWKWVDEGKVCGDVVFIMVKMINDKNETRTRYQKAYRNK
jgi:hypothetical protein